MDAGGNCCICMIGPSAVDVVDESFYDLMYVPQFIKKVRGQFIAVLSHLFLFLCGCSGTDKCRLFCDLLAVHLKREVQQFWVGLVC